MSIFFEASVIKPQKRVACVAQDCHGHKAQDKVDGENRYPYSGGAAKGYKQDKKSQNRVCYVNDYSVIRFDEKAAQVFVVAWAFQLVFVKACKTAPFGDFVLPELDLQLVIKISFLF